MKKMRQDNNMTNGIDSLYVENKTKLLRLIQRGMIYDKNEIERLWLIQRCMIYDEHSQDKDLTDCTSVVYAKIETQ